ncbi:hypothetical protein [Ureibacillus sinduriensis]|uniref:DUF4083 domain-containing protein n=1 Tax=Ureibacillus sinduriensis BLB-1 = JCM 15800 TaxID=1384057 RepID=A0A0A3I5N3_9BACL|nr:hypothetical protein [Ureibacillus sinduriensis]KGR78785.1 hypothetical protein CD33_00965 [Ureibacillus sinduriensis BLB-1 = JCM 15800]
MDHTSPADIFFLFTFLPIIFYLVLIVLAFYFVIKVVKFTKEKTKLDKDRNERLTEIIKILNQDKSMK